MPFVYNDTHEYEHFVIDAERSIKLPWHGMCEGHFEAQLLWHDQEVEIDYNSFPAEKKQNEKGEFIYEHRYSVWRIQIPDGFPEDKDTVSETIKEALCVFHSYERADNRIVTISVNLSPLFK